MPNKSSTCKRQAHQEDLACLYQALSHHPSFLFDAQREPFGRLYRSLQDTVSDVASLLDAMTALTMFFQDGHTNIELPYTDRDECLNIPCRWQDDRLVLTDDYMGLAPGTEITAVEHMSVGELTKAAAQVIPHENQHLVKSRMTEYPYQSYHIFSKHNLTRLFGEKASYQLTFTLRGQTQVLACVPETYHGFLAFTEVPAHYEIQGRRAVLHLDSCVCDEHYKTTLNELAAQCRLQHVELLELDLSRNMGGSSEVIDEFIKHVDIDSFYRYEMIRCSSGSKEVLCRRSEKAANLKGSPLFPKNIVCRISNTTFSSARTFAVTLKDNGIASIIGQPSGGKPSSYGMPRRGMTPNVGIRFRVSTCLFLRPDASLDDQDALYPTL